MALLELFASPEWRSKSRSGPGIVNALLHIFPVIVKNRVLDAAIVEAVLTELLRQRESMQLDEEEVWYVEMSLEVLAHVQYRKTKFQAFTKRIKKFNNSYVPSRRNLKKFIKIITKTSGLPLPFVDKIDSECRKLRVKRSFIYG